ncbi:MAG: hypothetical protein E6767_00515 [Dysgonomonas sp.]|nr:hypothetical protein [Dysgonomonas sp.]
MKEEITVSGLIELIESGERKNIRLRSWQLAKLFGVYESTINANVKAIIRADVIKVCLDCEVRLYGNILIPETCDLEMIIALSFRINTYEASMFRKWIIRKIISKPPNIIILPIDTPRIIN